MKIKSFKEKVKDNPAFWCGVVVGVVISLFVWVTL